MLNAARVIRSLRLVSVLTKISFGGLGNDLNNFFGSIELVMPVMLTLVLVCNFWMIMGKLL